MLDEHGMPLPLEEIPLPLWIDKVKFVDTVRDSLDEEVNLWDMPEFFVHAANNIIPAREIVRRLAECSNVKNLEEFQILAARIVDDAAKLWANMQRDAKGGDGE